jgi:anti-sigma factor RsiW
MRSHHITHLLSRYVQGQLRPAQRAEVVNHARECERCRAALAREERLVADLRREMPLIGQASAGQLSQVWVGVWQEIGSPGAPRSGGLPGWLPGLSLALVMLLVVVIALPVIAGSELRAEAALTQALPQDIATASPTPGVTDEARVVGADAAMPLPQATVAFAGSMWASPAPVPRVTVSPMALRGVPNR